MNSLINKRIEKPVTMVAGILLTTLLSACSTPWLGGYGASGQTKEEFARYVESVFKFQNQMTSKVMMLLESEDYFGDYEAILQAEQKMREICEPLNEYATRENDGMSIGLFLRRRVEKSAVACDKAARRVDDYLNALNKARSPDAKIVRPHSLS